MQCCLVFDFCYVKKQSIVMYICNFIIREMEEGGLKVYGQLLLFSDFVLGYLGFCVKRKNKNIYILNYILM